MRKQMRTYPSLLGSLLVLALVAFFALPVYADRTFHTEQQPLVLTSAGAAAGHPDLRAGHVVDVHANGPQIYSLERYMLNGAKPNTAYQVTLSVSLTGCGSPQNVQVPTALLSTNAQGDANGNWTFTPQDVAAAGLHAGMTLGITWMFVSGGVAVYQTPACVNVGLD